MLKFIVSLLLLSVFFWSGAVYSDENTITLKKPPEELAKWYKPANKRQVWLHTMFRLRRELLAMNDYSLQQKPAELKKWSDKFVKDYQSIAKMVPQWQDYLFTDKLQELQQRVAESNYAAVPSLLKKISKSCMNCHDDYQTVATLLYRSVNFNDRNIKQSTSGQQMGYADNMMQLSDSVNRINIAIKDGYFTVAEKHMAPLTKQLDHLAGSCADCHQQDEVPLKRIMDASRVLLPELAEQLALKEQKQSGRTLGEFAVKVCARCHSIHRLPSDLQLLFD